MTRKLLHNKVRNQILYLLILRKFYTFQINVAFFGGVYGSQPVGREMVMRLARHVAEGAKRNDVTISRLLDKLNIYFLPTIDRDGFEQVIASMAYKNNTLCLPLKDFFRNVQFRNENESLRSERNFFQTNFFAQDKFLAKFS